MTAGGSILAGAHRLPVDGPGIANLTIALARELAWPLLLPLLALLAAPIAAAVLQNGVVWTGEPLQPKLERISPLAGARRLFSVRALFELPKSLAKVALVAGALGLLLWPELPRMIAASGLEAGPLAAYLRIWSAAR